MIVSKFKEKYTQFLINACKGPSCYYHGNVIVLNLCSCFIKKNNFVKFNSLIKEATEFGDTLNLTNLASLCHKWGMLYGGTECMSFVENLKKILKTEYPKLKLSQDGIYNYGEIDMKPLESVIRFDPETNGIYINNVLMESLKYLGYVNSQIFNILQVTGNFNKILPPDIIETLPLENEYTLQQYDKIKEMILS